MVMYVRPTAKPLTHANLQKCHNIYYRLNVWLVSGQSIG